jgi:hypothetical protein
MTATTLDRLNGINSGIAIKAPVRVATTANIALSGAQTIDGVAVVADDRVLVKSQTNGVENGIYDVSSGSWTRSLDFDGNRDVVTGTMVLVTAGTLYANTVWSISTTGTITIDTTSITFAQNPTLSGTSAFMLTLLDDTSSGAALTTLGVSAFAQTVLDDTTAAAARTTLGALSDAAGVITGTNLNNSVINDLTTVTAASGDYVAIADVSDSNNKKKALISDIVAMVSLNTKVGSFTFDMTAATGTVAVTGVGFQPRAILLLGAVSATPACSMGFSDGTDDFCIAQNDGGTADNWSPSTTAVVRITTAIGNFQVFTLNSFDADGFTLGNTKTSSPTGTVTFGYIAIR